MAPADEWGSSRDLEVAVALDGFAASLAAAALALMQARTLGGGPSCSGSRDAVVAAMLPDFRGEYAATWVMTSSGPELRVRKLP